MTCAEPITHYPSGNPVGGCLTFDATACAPVVLSWHGSVWWRYCSAACAFFGRHVSEVRVLPSGGVEVPTR